MIILVLRIVGFCVLLYFGAQLIRKLLPNGKSVKCVRCDGLGYWYSTRERNKCEVCEGEGRIYYEELEKH